MKKTGIELIAQERAEQIEKHGWSSEHDNGHRHGELRKVAATLCAYGTDCIVTDEDDLHGTFNDPWGLVSKLAGNDIHRLQVAGALIAAEIDRLQNLNPQ